MVIILLVISIFSNNKKLFPTKKNIIKITLTNEIKIVYKMLLIYYN